MDAKERLLAEKFVKAIEERLEIRCQVRLCRNPSRSEKKTS